MCPNKMTNLYCGLIPCELARQKQSRRLDLVQSSVHTTFACTIPKYAFKFDTGR